MSRWMKMVKNMNKHRRLRMESRVNNMKKIVYMMSNRSNRSRRRMKWMLISYQKEC